MSRNRTAEVTKTTSPSDQVEKMEIDELLHEAQASLERMQLFDASQLPREAELGQSMSFREAVEPAERLVSLYKRLSVLALDDLSLQALTTVRDRANADYALFTQVLHFDLANQQHPTARRNDLIREIKNAYDPSFQHLHPYIAYSVHRSADFQRLNTDARSTLQAILDRSEVVQGQLRQHEADAKVALEQIRAVAAEEGVTQQAIHFSSEAKQHEDDAEKWRRTTVRLALGLGLYAAASAFIHKIPFLAPTSAYETIQLAVSKILVFSVLAYMLILSARNFLNHKHNAIVNRHRQNALMTHRALIEAASDQGIRDTIMVQAAGCIFSPQGTGYTGQQGGESQGAKSVVELLTKSVTKTE